MERIFANILGDWVDLNEAKAIVSRAAAGEASVGHLDAGNDFLRIDMEGKTYYVDESCIQFVHD